ncbi:DUF4365 domain-containing protein [Methylobacterium oryzihabitans]|uniref:DUF4365 domain-containing protein n=1 Tax=Methylobacterium oryzihabitans TaxID=2499852 RepID=A0A3S2YJS9_9HYPH|nr:DUF4365 domain-containing protein [Methylobacterium oryzihabitans]RVU13182.1 DUF4365 domain-containing protein [Methylobacterium oryzihabitans]
MQWGARGTEMTRANDATGEIGVAVAKYVFSHANWLFRDQPLQDYGIDAQVEPKENGIPTGQLIGLQIKTGKSFFKHEQDESFTFYGEPKHLNYWTNHCLPVFIILHHPDTKLTIWQKVETRFITLTDAGWKIEIPKANLLNGDAMSFFKAGVARDPSSFMRSSLALDYPMMLAIHAHNTFMKVLQFNHKSLNMRGAFFYFGNPDNSDPDIKVERWLPFSDIHDYMARRFPWLEYNHIRELADPTGAIEGEEHILEVRLNHVGLAFLNLEEFFENGPTPKEYELPYRESDVMDDEEMDEWGYRHGVDED